MLILSNLLPFKVYFWDVITNNFLKFLTFSVHQDIWDEMKTRPYFAPFLSSKNINNEPTKNFLRFAPTNIPGLEEDHSVHDYFQEDCYQRRRSIFPHQNSLKVFSQHVHPNDKVCT